MFLDEATRRGLFDRAVLHWNERRFFEAHEDWEALWHEADDPQRLWLQGLIQFAAAFVHFERGFHATGFCKLLRGGAEKAFGYAGDALRMRFDLLEDDLRPWLEHARRVEAGAPLRQGAPPLPAIRYEEGFVPSPLALDAPLP